MTSVSPFVSAGLPESLHALAAHFAAATGLHCVAVDSAGMPVVPRHHSTNTVGNPVNENPGCRFCRMANARKTTFLCDGVAVHCDAIRQANRFGGSFIYFCPANLVHWTATVYVDSRVVGALVAGSVLMNDPEDYLSEEMSSTLPRTSGDQDELFNRFKAVPYIPPTRISSLAKVLSDMALGLSQKLTNNALWETHVEGQQARISEYIHQLKIDHGALKNPDYPLIKERTLLSLISHGDYANANRLLNELLGFILFASGRDMRLTKARILELEVLMSRAALEGGASVDAILKLNDDFLTKVQKNTSIEELSVSLADMLRRFSECMFTLKPTKHADLAHKALQYLNTHYARRFDLQAVADHLHVSAAHFSKVFKQEMGQSFVFVLNQIRVEHCKELLRDQSISLSGIAGLVGFEDQSYFTRVFKKHVGMSPGKYRSCRGRPTDPHSRSTNRPSAFQRSSEVLRL
ncbi:MAG: helix-turn-helix domain-containing protein [Propionivibrio sp.]